MKYNGIFNTPWDRTTVTQAYVWWDNAFTDTELQNVIDYCEDKGLERGKILSGPKNVDKIRRCDIKFHHRNDDTAWFFDRLNNIMTSLNNQFYGFELNGYDSFQYTSYNAAENGKYDWHMDTCLGTEGLPSNMYEPRKLSMTLLLNDNFEGGEFMLNLGNEAHPMLVPVTKGRAIVFPSFLLHCVKPVTKGFRKSVVIWCTGPKWV